MSNLWRDESQEYPIADKFRDDNIKSRTLGNGVIGTGSAISDINN